MIVFDQFSSKRNKYYGKCANCNRYNTSETWCQTCDLLKTTRGWTSGNKDVDNCIHQWILFSKLDNIQKIGDRFFAIWLDGMRYTKYFNENYEYEYKQLR